MFEKKMTVQLSEADYLHFNSYHIKNRPAGKKAFVMHLLLAPIISLFAILIFVLARADLSLTITEAVAMTVFSVIWMAFAKKRLMRRARRRYRKTVKKDPDAFPPVELTFTEDGFSFVEPRETGSVRYSMIKHVGEDTNGLYLYRNDVMGYVLPARCFASPEEQAQFAEFIRKKAEEQKADNANV